MELGNQIKKYRSELQLSQDQLAEHIYVSRQTISNWENEKSYPDVNSLVLLSEVFKTSIDNLIKGDIENMKEKINEQEIKKFNYYGNIFTVHLVITLLSAVPLFFWLERLAFIPFGILFVITMYWALKVEKVKKDNDIQTYKEIVAFSEGKRLDENTEAARNRETTISKCTENDCSCNCCNRSMFFDWTIVSFAWKLDTCFWNNRHRKGL